MKTRPVGGELFLAYGQMDRRTDRYDEANSRFSQFSKISCSYHVRLRNLPSVSPYVRSASACSSVCDLVSTATTYVGFS